MFVPVPVQLARPIISVSTCYAHISRCVCGISAVTRIKFQVQSAFFSMSKGESYCVVCVRFSIFQVTNQPLRFFGCCFLFKLKIQIQIELLTGQSISIFQEHVYPNTLSLHVNIYHAVGDGFVNQKKNLNLKTVTF